MPRKYRIAILLVVLGAAIGLWISRQHWSVLPVHEERWVWQPAFVGVELAAMRTTKFGNQHMYAARIDLTAPGIRLRASEGLAPDNGGMTSRGMPAEATSSTTAAWLDSSGCQLAINAAAYGPVVDDSGVPMTIRGLHVSGGVVHSPTEPLFNVVAVRPGNDVTITSPDADFAGVQEAVSGFELIVGDGKVLDHIRRNPDVAPRTAVGLTADRKTMYWLVIDGRQRGYSEGVSLLQLAEIMLGLGAHAAINLDGGGSATLVRAGADGQPELLNWPIHAGKPGQMRPNANHLGLWALPLP